MKDPGRVADDATQRPDPEVPEPFHAVVYRMQSPQPARSVTDHMHQRDAPATPAGQLVVGENRRTSRSLALRASRTNRIIDSTAPD